VTIICTPDHPFYVKGKGWAVFAPELSMYPQRGAIDPALIRSNEDLSSVLQTLSRLEVGDILVSQRAGEGECRVIQIQAHHFEKCIPTFCLMTSSESFFVCDSLNEFAVLVHNITISVQMKNGEKISLEANHGDTMADIKLKLCDAWK
jgi:hypothetical protein